MKKKRLYTLICFLVGTCCFNSTQGQEITLASSSSIPPYVISEKNQGIVVDIIRESMAHQGYQVNFIYAANRRIELFLKERQVDAAFNLPERLLEQSHISQPLLSYHNVVVTLADKNLHIDTTEDLANLRIATFQNAHQFLGPDFAKMVQRIKYTEVTNQKSQLRMLTGERVDAIILDHWIFHYYFEQVELPAQLSDFRFHWIFSPAPRPVAFNDPELRDQFDKGLNQLRASGRYQKILDHYLPAVSNP